jgi:hypothetical protein
MSYMEPGLGYYYPAGTPAPREEARTAHCKVCDYTAPATLIFDLGTVDVIVDGKFTNGECPNCGYDAPPLEMSRDREW